MTIPVPPETLQRYNVAHFSLAMWQELQSVAAKTQALTAMIESHTQNCQHAFQQDLEYVLCSSPSPKINTGDQIILENNDHYKVQFPTHIKGTTLL